MSVRSRLAPSILVPLAERLSGRRPWTELDGLRGLQWRSPEELEARALARLRPLLAHARAHVPYYRELFERAAVRPDEIRTVADLSRVPTSGKAELRANFPAGVIADNLPPRRRRTRSTSGSTGLPFQFYTDRADADRQAAFALLLLEWAGVAQAGAVLVIGSSTRAILRPRGSWVHDVALRVLLGKRVVRLDGTGLAATDFLAHLGRLPPGCDYYIQGRPSYTARLAARLLRAGTELPVYPGVVITGAETQTATDLAIIERAFRCPVLNRYGSWEVGYLAQTCPDNPSALHVNGERLILRVVREDGSPAAPGESGRLMVTDLGNWVMPFINYDIGDRAQTGDPCSCGRGFPTLTGLEGRTTEVIRTPNGRVVSAATLQYFRRVVPGALDAVWEFQAVQTAADAVVLRIVPTPRLTPEFVRAVEEELSNFLGPGMDVRVETVGQIAVEPSGKRLIIKSELAPGDDD